MKPRKNLLIWAIISALAISVTACGNSKDVDTSSQTQDKVVDTETETPDESISYPETASQEEKNEKTSSNPTFSGDTIKFFGMEHDEAFELAGIGATTNSSQYIINENIGLELFLTNSVDDMATYRVNGVCFDSAEADLSFMGIYIGNSLKEADKILMEQDTIYRGELTWVFGTEEREYTVKLTTSDDTNIDSIEVNSIEYSELYSKEKEELNNSFGYEQDMHELEFYWE